MNSIAIIPARGGSKRIPNKNLRNFCGKPIIAYSIETAKNSGLFERILVSTDSEAIAEKSKEMGAEVNGLRPAELSGDYATTDSVLKYELNLLKSSDKLPAYVCCLYPTAPFVSSESLVMGKKKLVESSATTCLSITSFPFPIFRAVRKKGDNLEMFWPEFRETRSQDLEEAYHDAGQFYWMDTQKYLKEGRLYASHSVGVVLPRKNVQDIDTWEDWEVAENKYMATIAKETIKP